MATIKTSQKKTFVSKASSQLPPKPNYLSKVIKYGGLTLLSSYMLYNSFDFMERPGPDVKQYHSLSSTLDVLEENKSYALNKASTYAASAPEFQAISHNIATAYDPIIQNIENRIGSLGGSFSDESFSDFVFKHKLGFGLMLLGVVGFTSGIVGTAATYDLKRTYDARVKEQISK